MYQEYIEIEDGFMIIEQENPGNSETKSKYKNWFGVNFLDKDNKFCNGEKTLSDGTIVRYVNGYIDGNIYDHFGNVIYTHPAIEYSEGREYWIAPCSAFISLQVQLC